MASWPIRPLAAPTPQKQKQNKKALAQEDKDALRQQVWAAKRVDNSNNSPTAEDRAAAAELFQQEKLTLVSDVLFISVHTSSL